MLLFWLSLAIMACSRPNNATEPERWKAQAARVTIIRDDFGIPHIYGKTDADAVFGMLYAQCED
ncbi:MAG: penicillin acylase family protein, partial [Saprospiraceae bacterium]|nr:penicillin acylase family protein [Saprospiraceae bacterium]